MLVAGAKILEKGLKALEVGGGLYRLGHGKFICLGILHRGSRQGVKLSFIVSLSYFSVDLLARFLDLQETFRIYEDEMNKFRISIPKGDPFAIFSSNMFRLYSTSSSLVNVELFTFCSCAFYHHKTNNVLQYMEDETEKFQPQVAKVDGIIVQIDLIN
ncbi:hypothetical protein BHM03_00014308 [Ensete ventricosum]|nr:hypothetical protein BHM03_00014308 [Ensete ventricosum]